MTANQQLDEGLGKLIQAIVNEHEVEKTPEERVISYFNEITPEGWKFNNNDKDSIYLRRSDIRAICSILGFHIKGVNA